MANGWLIAAPSSGAGKTTVTLGLLRALARRGTAVAPFKSGPDYIDPSFHAAAAGVASFNLDAWAMTPDRLTAIASGGTGTVIVEGAMGLFDGAANGSGSAAELAKTLGLSVVLVIDCAKQAQSVGALVHGFSNFDPSVRVAGVILNRVASDKHEAMLRAALPDVQVVGAVRRAEALGLPERHLGLVPAAEHQELEFFLEAAADIAERSLDLDFFAASEPTRTSAPRCKPFGQRMAVARDVAFAFAYPHLLDDWRASGAELVPFSPLADEAPDRTANAVFLPGGYPELHAGTLASNENALSGLREAARRGATIYGECGGYMLLGEGLVDANGKRHAMTGLLSLETSFAERKLQLGYRNLTTVAGAVFGCETLKAHEFHHCTASKEAGDALFHAADASGVVLGKAGLRSSNVMGSWMHVIDAVQP